MVSWIDQLRSRCGPLSEAAMLFATRLGVERDPPAGAAGLMALARSVEHHLEQAAPPEAEERAFIEHAGAYFGLLLCAALPRSRHERRDGRHGVLLESRRFFDPFAAVEDLLGADDVRACLAEQVARAEREAHAGTEGWADIESRIVPRLAGPELLAEIGRRGGGHVHARPFVCDMRLLFVVREPDRARYLTETELERFGQQPAALFATALRNLARISHAARLLRIDSDEGAIVVARTGDGLDAARLLLPGLHDVLAPELGSPFAAAVPHRDALFACSLRNPADLRLLRERVALEASRSVFAISQALVEVGPSGRLSPLPRAPHRPA